MDLGIVGDVEVSDLARALQIGQNQFSALGQRNPVILHVVLGDAFRDPKQVGEGLGQPRPADGKQEEQGRQNRTARLASAKGGPLIWMGKGREAATIPAGVWVEPDRPIFPANSARAGVLIGNRPQPKPARARKGSLNSKSGLDKVAEVG